jgi:hypothetical protein
VKVKVSLAYLQAAVKVPGMGIMAETTLGGQKTPGIDITTSDYGLVLTKGNLHAIIPWANVKMATFEQLEIPSTLKK